MRADWSTASEEWRDFRKTGLGGMAFVSKPLGRVFSSFRRKVVFAVERGKRDFNWPAHTDPIHFYSGSRIGHHSPRLTPSKSVSRFF